MKKNSFLAVVFNKCIKVFLNKQFAHRIVEHIYCPPKRNYLDISAFVEKNEWHWNIYNQAQMQILVSFLWICQVMTLSQSFNFFKCLIMSCFVVWWTNCVTLALFPSTTTTESSKSFNQFRPRVLIRLNGGVHWQLLHHITP